jgi:large subunit ribosomal protein L15
MRREKGGVKLLGQGEFKAKAEFSVWGASKSAREAIEKAGGSVEVIEVVPAAEKAAAKKGQTLAAKKTARG